MVLLVKMDALFGVRRTEPARVSCALVSTQVSLKRVATFSSDSSKMFWQFFAGHDVRVVSMNLVHKSLSFSGYHSEHVFYGFEGDGIATSIPHSSRIVTT